MLGLDLTCEHTTLTQPGVFTTWQFPTAPYFTYNVKTSEYSGTLIARRPDNQIRLELKMR